MTVQERINEMVSRGEYQVVCDESNNTPEDIAHGRLNVTIKECPPTELPRMTEELEEERAKCFQEISRTIESCLHKRLCSDNEAL